MNHSDAIKSKAAAGYLLGDLSEAERDAFEQHYIDCPICAETVWSGTTMFAAGREVVQPVPIPTPVPRVLTFRQRFQQAAALATAAALTVVVGYQGFIIPSIRAARMETLTAGDVITGTMRASENADYVMHFVGNRARLDYVDITDRSHPEYRIQLRNAAGKLVHETGATAEEVRSSETGVPLLIRPLPAGRYLLTIEGVRKEGNRTEIGRRNVVVQ